MSAPALGLSLLALMLSACAGPAPPPWPPVVPREPRVDILDYEIQADLHHRAGFLDGLVAVEFRALPGAPVNSLVLDAVELDVRRTWDSQGRELAVDENATSLEIHLAEPLEAGNHEVVSIEYGAFPPRGLHFEPPPSGGDGGWQVWSQGQSEDTRFWMPVWDMPNDRATHTLALTVDDDLATLCAGELVDSYRNEQTGRRTDTWRMDGTHPSYLITLVAGDFDRTDLGDGPVPLPVLSHAAQLPMALAGTERTADMLRFLAEFTGRPYPYVKYAQTFVRDFTGGGMENVSATTLFEEGLHLSDDLPQADLDWLIMHEAAHQWFGDLITCGSWTDLWLNEGFADYSEVLYMGERHGPAHMAMTLLEKQRIAVEAADAMPRPIVWDGYGDPDRAFDSHVYEGAGTRLHLLRTQMGDEAFLAGVRRYVSEHADDLVDTDDLRRSLEAASGQHLGTFFDEWYRGNGYPIFDVRLEPSGADPVLVARQVQGELGMRAVFHVAVAAAWSRGGVEARERLVFDADREELPLTGEGELDWVRFDADGAVPGRIRMHQPAEMWARQLATASDPVTRRLAALWLAGDPWLRPSPADLAEDAMRAAPLLRTVARDDPFVHTRVAAIGALALAPDEDTLAALRVLARDADARVRVAAVAVLGKVSLPADEALLREAAGDDNAAVVEAAVQALAAVDHPDTIDIIMETVRSTPKLRLARNLVRQIDSFDDPRVLPFLMDLAATHPARDLRAAAVERLAPYAGPHVDAVFRRLCAALNDVSHLVRAAAADALATQGRRQDAARARLHLRARRDIEADQWALEALDEALQRLP